MVKMIALAAMTPGRAKLLLVNADDFGYSSGVTRGIAEAAQRGILTATSVMARRVSRADADLALGLGVSQGLSLGLHLELDPGHGGHPHPGHGGHPHPGQVAREPAALASEIAGQYACFLERFGRPPSHLDTHHHTHLEPVVLGAVAHAAREYGLPVRSPTAEVRACLRGLGIATADAFVGGPEPFIHWTVNLLLAAIADARPGITELCCHPGYVTADLRSSYREGRETELSALTDPRVRAALREHDVALAGWEAVRSAGP